MQFQLKILNKAQEISDEFNEKWDLWQIVGFLERFGIGAENAKKIYDLLGINAIEEIESNPYILIDMARGVDFKQIDQMALKLGISYDNQKRVESGIKYGLIKATYNGHSCVIKQNLLERMSNVRGDLPYNIELGVPLKFTRQSSRLIILNLINGTPGVTGCDVLKEYISNKKYVMDVQVHTQFGTFTVTVQLT